MALIITGLVFAIDFGTASASAVAGTIYYDTTWTKANSPYSLTNDVIVNSGVTLTIEAGTIVNLNGFNLNVEGTLLAEGNSNAKITFNDATNGLTIGGASTISRSKIYGRIVIVGGSPIISDNVIEAIPPEDADNIAGNITHGYIPAGNIVIDERNVGIFLKGTVADVFIANNFISGGADGIKVQADGSVTIQGNTLQENIVYGIEITSAAHVRITSNYFSHNIGSAIVDQGEAYLVIQNNTLEYGPADMRHSIYNSLTGIELHGNTHDPNIVGNYISGCVVGIGNGAGTIERNLFNKNSDALHLAFGVSCLVQNNTIISNSRGIAAPSSASTIIYNNIVNSFETGSLWLTNPSDVDAIYNYWGTTDTQTISQGIITNGFGDVTFKPFLTELNPQAMPDNMTISVPTSTTSPTTVPTSKPTTVTSKPTATATQFPTTTPDQPDTITSVLLGWNTVDIMIIALLSIIAVLLVFVVFYLRKRSLK